MSSRPFPVIVTAATNPLAANDLRRLARREAIGWLARAAESATASGATLKPTGNTSATVYVIDRWGHNSDDTDHAERMTALLLKTGWLSVDGEGRVSELMPDESTEQSRQESLNAWHVASEIADDPLED